MYAASDVEKTDRSGFVVVSPYAQRESAVMPLDVVPALS